MNELQVAGESEGQRLGGRLAAPNASSSEAESAEVDESASQAESAEVDEGASQAAAANASSPQAAAANTSSPQAGAANVSSSQAAAAASPAADATAPQAAAPIMGANIFSPIEDHNPHTDATTRSTYVSVYDRLGLKGNPLIWTMSIVYGSLTVLALLLFVVWSDVGPRRVERPKPDTGLPAGYAQYVL